MCAESQDMLAKLIDDDMAEAILVVCIHNPFCLFNVSNIQVSRSQLEDGLKLLNRHHAGGLVAPGTSVHDWARQEGNAIKQMLIWVRVAEYLSNDNPIMKDLCTRRRLYKQRWEVSDDQLVDSVGSSLPRSSSSSMPEKRRRLIKDTI